MSEPLTDHSFMPFGKHKGKPMSQVPDHYLQYCADKMDGLHDNMIEYIQQRLGNATQSIREYDQDDSEPLSARRTLSHCNSCHAEIMWTKINGKNHPLNPKALRVAVKSGDKWIFVEGWESHFSSCPNADEHRGTGQDSNEPEPAKEEPKGGGSKAPF